MTDSSASPAVHPVCQDDDALLRQCTLRFLRSSGPGGQHRNKTESAVVLHHRPTGVEGQASERRSQADNRQMALKRLRVNLALQVRSPDLAAAAPTALWRSRCRNERIAINPDHHDLAPLLAEALDVIADRQGNTHSAAEQLGCTHSQLVKFLKLEPRGLKEANEVRRAQGLRELG